MPIKHALNPTERDDRDFSLGAITVLPDLNELPESFCLQTLAVKDQGESDFCAAFSSITLSEIQEGVLLSPEYQFALAKWVDKNINSFGTDLRSVLKTYSKYGSIEQGQAPFSLANRPVNFLRDIKNWDNNLLSWAQNHKKKSFFNITGPYSPAHNVRAAIWKFRDQKQGVLSGLLWHWGPCDRLLTGISSTGSGHAIPYIGWTPEGLILQNSIGSKAGNNGQQIIPYDVADYYLKMYQGFMMVDLDPEQVKTMLQAGIKLEDNWFIVFFKNLLNKILV